MENRIGWIRLGIAEGLGKNIKAKLVKSIKNPNDIFELTDIEFHRYGIRNTRNINAFRSNIHLKEAERIDRLVHKLKIRTLSLSSSDYPEYLKEIFDPPTVLYYFGDVKPDDVCMGIVGSRKSSEYGKNTAKSFASKLSQNGFAVVSGMARGIDTKAHEGALESEGKTYAIIGSGLDIVYPPENKKLMQKIIDNGAVISEFPPGTKPNPYNFPIRNRIISGMSLGVIVVEAGLRSGSLITANLALEQGRDVFAVPGNINRIINKGSNKLIKEGAKLVENIDDILEEYKTFINLDKSNNIKKTTKISNVSTDERKIIEVLSIENLHLEDISAKTEITIKDLNYLTLCLEMKGIISKDITGEYFINM